MRLVDELDCLLNVCYMLLWVLYLVRDNIFRCQTSLRLS